MELLLQAQSYLSTRPGFFTFIFWASLVLFVLTVITYSYLVISRLSYLYKRFRKQQVANDWQIVFNTLRKGEEPLQLPLTSRSNRRYLLELWYEEREIASGSYESALDELANRSNLADTICDILRPGKLEIAPRHIWLYALAIKAAHYIDTEETRRMVAVHADSDALFLAAQACACMARVKSEGYEKAILSLMFKFPGSIPDIFNEVSTAGGADALLAIQPILNRLPHHTLMNFITLAENSGDERLIPVMRARLLASRDNEEIAAIIRLIGRIGDKSHLQIVEPYLENDETFVRIQAARAYGRLGDYGGHEKLIPLLSDPEWWLRYRTARAIIKLTGHDAEALEDIQSGLNDRYAKEILIHAYEEMEWCRT